MTKNFTFIDLFCGLGGFRIAMEQLGGRCVFSSDIDEKVQQVYERNFGEKPFGDITQVEMSDIPEHDILCGGFPCQPFSIAGKRLGFEDTRGTLFFHIAEIIKNKKPKAVMLENVKGLVNHDGGRTLETIVSILNDLGYKVFYKVLNARNYGVPQNRERIILVGFLGKNPPFNFPINSVENLTLEEVIDLEDKEKNISKICKLNIENHLANNAKAKGLLERGKVVFAYEIRKSKCSFKGGDVSPCLTAKMGTGGNNVPVIVGLDRKISTKEGLRLMGFPSWYEVENSSHGYKQIGNSVAIPMIKSVGKELVRFI